MENVEPDGKDVSVKRLSAGLTQPYQCPAGTGEPFGPPMTQENLPPHGGEACPHCARPRMVHPEWVEYGTWRRAVRPHDLPPGMDPARERPSPDGRTPECTAEGPGEPWHRVERDADGWRCRLCDPIPLETLARDTCPARYGEHHRDAPPGLGRFRRSTGSMGWIYITPQGSEIPVSWEGKTEPPLPRPKDQWMKCGCYRSPHTCSACGTSYWVEYHGVADGYCTYCYRRG